MTFIHILSPVVAVASLFAFSEAGYPKLATHCDASQAGCEAIAEGDENELLQMKVRSNGTKPHFKYDQKKASAFAGLAKLTYCNAQGGTARSVEKTCGQKGFCKPAGVKVQKGSVRTVSLNDGSSKEGRNALVAFVARLEGVSGAEDPLEPGCVAAIRGTWPGTNNEERHKQQTLVPLKFGKCPTCRIHEGYQEIWKIFMPAITQAFKSIKCSKTTPIYLTGHSLGGAIATIGMYALKTYGWNVQPGYTFHNPKQGNSEWAKSVSQVVGSVTRLTHAQDNIPTFPWKANDDGSTYDFTWPEIHYEDKTPDESYVYEICWGEKNCGVLKYEDLHKQSECDEHLVSPLAPDLNFAMFKDYMGTCLWGKGAAAQSGDLPKAKKPAEQQLSWMSGKATHEEKPCVNGWQMARDCKSSFKYRGKTINGCTNEGSIITKSYWCSLDDTYSLRYNLCSPCGKDADWDISKDEEEAIYNPQ